MFFLFLKSTNQVGVILIVVSKGTAAPTVIKFWSGLLGSTALGYGIGTYTGAALGATTGRRESTLAGAEIGGKIGAAIGFNMGLEIGFKNAIFL
jgi:hypothetical protein